MPRRKQDCPKRMKWEEGEGKMVEDTLQDGEDSASPASSPRHRRDSGSVASHSPRASPRESLSPIPSPRLTPSRNRHSSPHSDSDGDALDFSSYHHHNLPSPIPREDLRSLSSKSQSPLPLGFPRLGDSPLDLSVPRKRAAADALLEAASKMSPFDLKGLSPWGLPIPPHIASTLMLHPEFLHTWNGKLKSESSFPVIGVHNPEAATKALERMSELSKLGGGDAMSLHSSSSEAFRLSASGSSGARANAWQSHWLSKGQDATKDVLKCVWCKASFNTLADLTTHMKEAKHCGVNVPPPSIPPHLPPTKLLSNKISVSSQSSSSSDLVSSIKETMPLPRKLVRGQDVWLGKGAEQTRQILKCMWCGQSFKSLAEMTRHMQQTQHYTNIISQEQIISWKSPEEKSSAQTHVNAVLTCKVCDQAFSSLKELSNHMVKYAHYKEHIMRSITESGSRRRQTREKRKKSLPVRKLLELERAQQELRASGDTARIKDSGGTPTRVTCEKCGEKIDSHLFVQHIRTCVGGEKEIYKPTATSPEKDIDGRKSPKAPSPKSENEPQESSSVLYAIEKLIEKSFDSGKNKSGGSPLGSSILRRLGIDESTDYSKPLVEPQLMGMYATFSRLHGSHSLGNSTSFNLPPSFGGTGFRPGPDPALSPDSYTRDTPPVRCGSRPASCDPPSRDGSFSDHSVEFLRPEHQNSDVEEENATVNGHNSDVERSALKEDKVNGEISPRASFPIEKKHTKEELRVKDEFKLKEELKQVSLNARSESPSHRSSPARSSRSGTPLSEGGFGSLMGEDTVSCSSHPLAALQKLCDKTETQPRSSVTSNVTQSNPGAILAFSWACNDAVTADSIMKCAFCDTPFISKGAYRHHLSKMHFVKDGVIPDSGGNAKPQSNKLSPAAPTPPAPQIDDSPHSKFLKYTELAKQLSSK